MSTMSAITPGRHLFTSARTHLTFEYIVQSSSVPSTERLIVVQCPAWGLGSRYLQHGLSPFANNHSSNTLLFFHPRGTDGSSRPASASQMTSMPDLSTDLDDLRQHLHLDSLPTLLGHSNGGAIALGYAETHPNRVKRLILLNHQLIGTSERRLITERATLGHDPRYRAAIAYSPSPQPQTDTSFTRDITALWPLYFYNPQRYLSTLLSAIGDRIFPLWCYTAVYGCDGALQRPRQMIDGLGAVEADTLIIAGRDDLACGPSIAQQTAAGIPGARVLVYSECGHFPWIEQRERFMGDVQCFLRGG